MSAERQEPVLAEKWAPRWDEGHVLMSLTLKLGPKAGTTLVYCTCEWSRIYGTQVGGRRGQNAHMKLNGVGA